MRSIYFALLFLSMSIGASGLQKNLIIVNSLGETADFVNLQDSIVTVNVATLGLSPNDFVVLGSMGIAVNSLSNDLQFFTLPVMDLDTAIFLGGSRNPWQGAISDSLLIVTNLLTSTVSKVNVLSKTILGEFPVGQSPQGIVFSDNSFPYAYLCITAFDFNDFTYGQGALQKFSVDDDTVVATINVGTNPQDAAFGQDGFLYVVCTGNFATQFGIVYKVDVANEIVVDSLAIGGMPSSIAVTRSGIMFLGAGGFVGNGEIYTIDINSWSVRRGPSNPIQTDLGVTAVTAVSDTSVVSCNFSDDTVTEVDTAGQILARFSVGDGPVAASKYPSCYQTSGDADASSVVDISDAVYLIQFIFAGGPAPIPMVAGDADCSATVDISDAVYLIQHIFLGGPLCGCFDNFD